MATLATLRTAVSSKLGLDNTAASAEQVLIDSWLNQGVLEVLLRTHCTVEPGTMNTTASTWQYELDTGILAIRNLWREDDNGDVEKSIHLSEQELVDLHRASSSSDAAFLHYAVAGSNLLLIWPTPSSVYAMDFLYVPRPTALTSASHDPSNAGYGRIPTEFHKAIEYYALWQGAEFDENTVSGGGERYRALFEDYVTRFMRPAITRKGNYELPRARTRRGAWRTRQTIRRENDRY